MKIIERNIIRWLFLAAFPLAVMASCSSDAPDEDRGGIPIGQTVSMRIVVGSETAGRSSIPVTNEEEAGLASENDIDIEKGDYRILFFDNDGNFISKFEPAPADITFDPTVSGGRVYNIIGSLSSKLPDEKFKVVVLANWGEDKYPTGVTTIEGVYSTLYDYSDYTLDFKPFNGENGKGIPMFGIKTCTTDVSMTPDQLYPLGTINMLRAMAKVEIICEDEKIKITKAELNCVNPKGYFTPLPSDVDESGDTWNVTEVHIPGNLSVEEKVNVKEYKDEEAANKVAFYIPEYRNLVGDAVVKLNFQFAEQESGTSHTREESIYFKDYARDNTFFDIARNYVYRFRVRFGTTFDVDYTICPWEEYEVDDIPTFD